MKREILEIGKKHLTLGGKPFYLASGDMHYFRFFKDGWKRRLQLMKDFGLTTLQTYVPWNLHEPREGEFHFEDNLNIGEFLKLCDEVGLKVLFRPSGYMCSEWELGGLPSWLLNKGVDIRTSEEGFMKCLRNYYQRLCKEFVPYLSTNGGPIIAVAVENEYGSFADDRDYIKQVGDLLIEFGVDVPLFTANGHEPFKMDAGSCKEYWTGVDCHGLNEVVEEHCWSYQPDKPIYIGEFWGGRSQQWGGYFARQKAEDVAQLYKMQLEKGAYVNFYMFCGGTNFGFMNGAVEGRFGADKPDAPNRYIAYATSYDVDAPVSEHGVPTEKYFACKKVLKEYLQKTYGADAFTGNDAECIADYPYHAQSIENIAMKQQGDFFGNVKNLAVLCKSSGFPRTFQEMGQDYGYMLYTTKIIYTDDQQRKIRINGLHDRATIYVNGKYLDTLMRDQKEESVAFEVPKKGAQLDILVENMGRINYGMAMLKEDKGICGFVRVELVEEDGTNYPWNYTSKSNWVNYSLPFDELSKLDFTLPVSENNPGFFKGYFEAQSGVDTFVDMSGWKKGVVWINGFNLGRYWEIGPQGTLYVPGELVGEHNEIVVFELYSTRGGKQVQLVDTPSLDLIEEVKDLKVSVVG